MSLPSFARNQGRVRSLAGRLRRPGALLVLLTLALVMSLSSAPRAQAVEIGGVDLGDLTDYTLFIADGRDGFNRNDEPWLGDIAVDSQQADETGSGSNQYFEGTIFVNSNNAAGSTDTGPNPGVGFMDDWVGQSAYPAQIVYGQDALITQPGDHSSERNARHQCPAKKLPVDERLERLQ